MALQLVLSFGHVHLANLTTRTGVVSVAASGAASSRQDPAHHPANDGDGYCPICAAIHLASSSFLPDAPVLPVPFSFRRAEHFTHFTFISISLQRAAFQSRAPPVG